ncbi:MAG: thiamine-phosphate kinase [Dehalococcoidia bacterium]|nr:thiamine-phosphate kinase [Dehalococcoidia bacterium]
MKVSEIGEFGLIDLLAKKVGEAGLGSSDKLVIGIGDDAAVWRTDASLQLCTTDTLVQDVDFVLGTITWQEMGWKLLAANLSDIAAMGGAPQYAEVTLGLPGDTEVENVLSLYQGIIALGAEFPLCVVGGDITRAPLVILSVTLLGVATDDKLLTRSSAQLGDLIAVTGHLGSSAAGLEMLTSGLKLDKETTSLLREAHFRPQPRIKEGQSLVAHGVKAAIDISDGLVGDLTHICEASHVGARVHTEKLPVHPLVRDAFKQDYLNMALSGGEDFELLFTAPRTVIDGLGNLSGTPVTVIGEVVADNPGRVTLLDDEGNTLEWTKKGWDHFSAKKPL